MRHDQETIDEIYQYITNGDSEFIRMLAKSAMKNAVEVLTDMTADAPLADATRTIPGAINIREQAAQYTYDMLADFREEVNTQIENMRFEPHIEAFVQVKHRMEFFD